MDTIKIKINIDGELTRQDKLKLYKNNFILKITDTTEGHRITVSIPRYFFMNNSYLVSTNQEVKEVIEEVKQQILNIGHKIIKLKTEKIDYPFTYLMKSYENYSNFTNIFNILSLNSVLNNYLSAEYKAKWLEYFTQDVKDKTTYYIHNNNNKSNSDKKIRIYNQYAKISDDKKEISLLKFHELKQRIRIEVEMKKRIDISRKDLDLKEIKTAAYEVIEESMFKNIEQTKGELARRLANNLKIAMLESNYSLKNFITLNLDLILDFEIIKAALKLCYSNKHTFYKNSRKAKLILEDLEEEKDIFYFDNFKRIDDIRKKLKDEVISQNIMRGVYIG